MRRQLLGTVLSAMDKSSSSGPTITPVSLGGHPKPQKTFYRSSAGSASTRLPHRTTNRWTVQLVAPQAIKQHAKNKFQIWSRLCKCWLKIRLVQEKKEKKMNHRKVEGGSTLEAIWSNCYPSRANWRKLLGTTSRCLLNISEEETSQPLLILSPDAQYLINF